MAGEAGVSGKSGSSISSLSSSSSWAGGAPKAAAGGAFLLTALGGTHEWQVCLSWFVMIGGGLWGRGAAAGVVGGEVAKALTITLDSSDPDGPSTLKLETAVTTDWLGVWGRTPPPLSLVEKSSKHEMASRSTSSSSFPPSSNLRLILRKKGETEWGRTVPLLPIEEDEDPEPYPSSRGGAEGTTALDTTKEKKLHTISHISKK